MATSKAKPGLTGGGLQYRLSPGSFVPQSEREASQSPSSTVTTPLAEAEIDRLLSRLPALVEPSDDTKDFALRETADAPPRSGHVVSTQFPPPPGDELLPPETETVRSLTVLRVQPEGDVPLAERITVSFSQPMVPLSGQAEAEENIPVELTPSVPGTWRWMGTQILVFEPGTGKRLPMATRYRLTIPAGTRSENGGELAESRIATFQTPPPRLLNYAPTGNSEPLTPVFWLAFDQRVDPAEIASHAYLKLRDKRFALRLATSDEISASQEATQYDKREYDSPAGYSVQLTPVEPLPHDARITMAVPRETPSAEGPLRTSLEQIFTFSTYAALQVKDIYETRWTDNSLTITFNNSLDEKAFRSDNITITPPISDSIISVSDYDSALLIQGKISPETTYHITLPASLKDCYGQKLGKAVEKSITTSPVSPSVSGPNEPLIVCDPAAAPRIVFQSINTPSARVKLRAVTAKDWTAYVTYKNDWEKKGHLPGHLISNRLIPLETPANVWGETGIELTEEMRKSGGNLIVEWEGMVQDDGTPPRGDAWIQATSLSVMAHEDSTDLYAWVTDLATGKPISNADVTFLIAGREDSSTAGRTGPDGMVQMPLPQKAAQVLIVRHGAHTAILPASQWHWDRSGWRKQSQKDEARWFVFDDRQLYRPGETVHVKGWLRVQKAGKTGELIIPSGVRNISWSLSAQREETKLRGFTTVNAWGGFDIEITLPKTISLGTATLCFDDPKHNISALHRHSIQIQEFRRPEFEITAQLESAGPYVVGEESGADISVFAAYYAGGALGNASVSWKITATRTTYQPPGHAGFTFGKWTPWWRNSYDWRPSEAAQTLEGFTGSDGMHRLHIHFDSVGTAQPYLVQAEAIVQDVNRQAYSAASSLIVHPSSRYLGLKSRALFVDMGQKLGVDVLVCDIDGKIESGREIQFRAARRTWTYHKREWEESEADILEWTVHSEAEPIPTEFLPAAGGVWNIRATVLDEQERPNTSELTLWVSGGDNRPKPIGTTLPSEDVSLIPDRKEYEPGETAEVLVQAPFADAEGLLTVVHNGVVRTERFVVAGKGHVLRIPLPEGFLPGVGIDVRLAGSTPRTDVSGNPLPDLPPRPAYASGQISLAVSPTRQRLSVHVEPEHTALEPGGQTTVTVRIQDASGAPVANAEAAVVVVDESVLALAGWTLEDPLKAFYPFQGQSVSTKDLKQYVILEDAERVAENLAAPGWAPNLKKARALSEPDLLRAAAPAMAGAAFGGGEPEPPIALRKNFDALAAFAPSVQTDAEGIARIPVTLPDNLTRYRIVAVAVSGATQIGHGEAALTARLPLTARPSAPRFLNYGDLFELPVVLQNQTDEPLNVGVAVRGSNLSFPKIRGTQVTVPANDRVEVRFPAEAIRTGTARFQVAAAAEASADAAELSLPVWTPATTEAFATYGTIDRGAIVRTVGLPGDALPQFGGLEITTASTDLHELTDALSSLQKYPYDCSEQLSSRILAIAALKDVLGVFQSSGMPSPATMRTIAEKDIAKLVERQNDDGGFGFWSRRSKVYPYVSVHVAHALVLAQQKGFKVPEKLYNRSLGFIKGIETKFDSEYPESVRRLITAYALYVRHLAGSTDTKRAQQLFNQARPAELSAETVGFLLSVLPRNGPERETSRAWLNNIVSETASAAHFTTSYADGEYLVLGSNRRADAILLNALILDQPKSDLIPKLTRGLLDSRIRGHWSGTQEDAFALLALSRYFQTYEAEKPDFTARLWLGDKVAGEGEFHGRSTDRVSTTIPMAYLVEQSSDTQPLTIDKDGAAGRLYYRIGMNYAVRNLNAPAIDHGFVVKRIYEAVDNPTDVRHNPDGSWTIRAGARVRVRLTLFLKESRYHIALTDSLPAGFEALNDALKGTTAVRRDHPRSDWWRDWWDHENLRDERTEVFASRVWGGTYEYEYACRATTPGQFVVPPAKVEEMYAPETFGRTSTDRVKVM